MESKKSRAPSVALEERGDTNPPAKTVKNPDEVFIPYRYLGEIQMNLLFTKLAVGLSFISLAISLLTLAGK